VRRGRMTNKILKAALGQTDPNLKMEVHDLLNDKLIDLCRQHPYEALRRSIDVTASADGVLLPANLIDIRMVRNATANQDPFEVFRRDKKDLPPDDSGYRYYAEAYGQEPLVYKSDLEIGKGVDTFTSAGLTDDHTGDYIVFGEEPGYYLLTAAKEFEPTYYGPKIEADGEYIIRPAATRRLFVVDDNEEITTTLTTLRVYYWEHPQPLYLDVQEPPLPYPEALMLMVLRALPEARERRPVSLSELEAAIAECERLDGTWLLDVPPRSRTGRRFNATSTDIFATRGGSARVTPPWER
jgi:hypothetical protein